MLVKGNDLVVATHGRGFWIMDDLTALREITPEIVTAPAHLFDIAPTYRYLPVQVLSPRRPFRPGIWFARAADTVAYEDQREAGGLVKRVFLNGGENPTGGVTIDYDLGQPSGETTLTILDGHGQAIKRFSSEARDSSWIPADAGMNRFVWDLRYPGARELPVPTGFVSAEYPRAQAPVAPPGRYVARLAAGGQQYEQSFDIKRDPRLTATDEDLQAEFELMVKIRNRLSDVTDAIDRLRKVRQQLNERQRSGAKDPALVSAKEKLQAIEAALTRLPGPNSNMLPPKALNDRLAALSGEIQHADARPTQQMYAVFEALSGLVAEQLRLLEQVAHA
jgi:hypothetical protein